jgi:hypothetical protein
MSYSRIALEPRFAPCQDHPVGGHSLRAAMLDATVPSSTPASRRAFFRTASKSAVLALLATQAVSPALAEASARVMGATLGLRPPHFLAALELVTHVPAVFDFSPGRFVPDPDETYAVVSFGNSNGLDTWQGIRHYSTAERFAERMNRAGRGRWVVIKNFARAGATELEVDAQVTSRRTIRELRGVQNLAVFVDPCGDDFKHNLVTPAQVSSLRQFLYAIKPARVPPPALVHRRPQDALGLLEERRQALLSMGREAVYIASSVARDIGAIGDTTYRLLEDISRFYHPAYIFWINAANYGYAQFFSLGEHTDQHFPINAPAERIFARNVATAVNNQELLGIRRFLAREGHDVTTLVYIDAYRHITAAELADGPHYNDAGVELLAGLAAGQFV